LGFPGSRGWVGGVRGSHRIGGHRYIGTSSLFYIYRKKMGILNFKIKITSKF